MQKKENQKYKEELEEFAQIIKDKEMDEEQIDLGEFNKGDENDNRANLPQSKLMQTRISSQ